ncbi:MAG TPA: restriction endonuclease subunit S [Candidatus Pullichristensenella excrementipullorum]|nr:restriction endonuclease subunit S [Candidatus Pullichristensenella excrementipullorum]
MMEWIEKRLGDIGDVVGGATPSTKHEEYYGGKIAWITPKDLSSFKGRYILSGERNITEAGLDSCSAQMLPPNTVLFTSRAPIGYIAIAKQSVCTNQGFKSIVPHECVDSLFLYYLLKFNKDRIEAMGSGTTFKEVSRKTMREVQVRIPRLVNDQKKISCILNSIDSKIENNTKINDNLQQQAAALFANFYDQAETEVGFTEMIQILGGGTPKTGESSYWNGDIPFFTPKDVGFPYTLTTEKTITEEGLAHCNSRLYPINTVFVTARGTVGKVGLPGVPMAMNQSCYALVGKDTHQLLVYFYTLKAVDRLKHKASGAVFDAITTRDFEAENIMKLSDDDTKAFLDVAEPIYQAVLNNSIENLRLSELRDSLLPKLMNGEIDVTDIRL